MRLDGRDDFNSTGCYSIIGRLCVCLHVYIWDYNSTLASAAFSKLVRANAEYKCVKSKSKCIESTRVQIQESIIAHLTKRENRFVWLCGSPGTGKTAISMSVASTLDTR